VTPTVTEINLFASLYARYVHLQTSYSLLQSILTCSSCISIALAERTFCTSLYRRRAPRDIVKTLRLNTWDKMYKISELRKAGVTVLTWRQRLAVHIVVGLKTSVC